MAIAVSPATGKGNPMIITFASPKTFVYWNYQAVVDVWVPPPNPLWWGHYKWQFLTHKRCLTWQRGDKIPETKYLRRPKIPGDKKGMIWVCIENRDLFRTWSNTCRPNVTLLFSWESGKLSTISLLVRLRTSHVFLKCHPQKDEGWNLPLSALAYTFIYIHSHNQYLLIMYDVLGRVLNARDAAVNKTVGNALSPKCLYSWEYILYNYII